MKVAALKEGSLSTQAVIGVPRRSEVVMPVICQKPFAATVVVANVPQLPDAQFAALADYVKRGGGGGLELGNVDLRDSRLRRP